MLAAIGLIVGLIVLVFVHELGHFLAAKQAGIKVEEFGFGFPPRMKGWRRGETTYSINWLPFGGFVRIYGENKHRLETEVAETGAKIEIARAFFCAINLATLCGYCRRHFYKFYCGLAITFHSLHDRRSRGSGGD
jgi:regulator of sigma E protease